MSSGSRERHGTRYGEAVTTERHEVLVIGAGPAGAAAAYWLARAGRDVAMVEKKTFPREKTCGDGLTPRAVHQLREMGLEDELRHHHRHEGLRAVAHGITLELPWPSHPVFPSYGYMVRRRILDELVARHAVSAGAHMHQATEAVAPLLDGGLVTGAVVRGPDERTRELRARYVVVAEGANSRFGRAIGTERDRRFPLGIAIRGYVESPNDRDPFMESSLDLRDRSGSSLPGYGWIFPMGDGWINVGAGLLSTFRDYKTVNTTHLLSEFVAQLPERWGVTPVSERTPPVGGRLPMAGSVNPKVGPTWVVVGDAAGSVNPFNGEGIDYAYETGRLAAELIDESLGAGSALALQRYPQILDSTYGLYFKVARGFSHIIGRPELMHRLTAVGMQSRTLMEWALRIMANLLRDDELGPAEAAYRMAAAVARRVPEGSRA